MIPDGSFQETVNVRFGDGYVEKVKGFLPIKIDLQEGHENEEPEKMCLGDKVIKVDLHKKDSGQVYNIIHTSTGFYNVEDTASQPENLVPDDEQIAPNKYQVS